MRSIVIEGKTYQYFIGKQHVRIVNENGAKKAPDYAEISGRLWSDIERDSHNRSFSITPLEIANYIKNNFQ